MVIRGGNDDNINTANMEIRSVSAWEFGEFGQGKAWNGNVRGKGKGNFSNT
jgi:hypothetical protein